MTAIETTLERAKKLLPGADWEVSSESEGILLLVLPDGSPVITHDGITYLICDEDGNRDSEEKLSGPELVENLRAQVLGAREEADEIEALFAVYVEE